MNLLFLFLVQLSIPLIISLLVTYYLREVLRRLLLDLCGTLDRAQFWMRLSSVMIIITPVFFSFVFPGSAGLNGSRATWEQGHWIAGTDPMEGTALFVNLLQHTITMTLCGVLFSLGILVWVMVSRIPAKHDPLLLAQET